MAKRRVSSQDVAQRAGVSRTTVSFVLNNTPGKNISEETRQRVLEAASELGYEPNLDARRLAMLRDKAVGLFISHSESMVSDIYIFRLIEGMTQVLNRKRYGLVLQPVRVEETNYLEIARADELDGVVLVNAHDNDNGVQELLATGFPLVIVGTYNQPDVYQVDIDNRAAAAEMVNYLISIGHERIAMISHAPQVFHASRERVGGYRDALAAAGIAPRPDYVVEGDFTEASGRAAMDRLLALTPRPTAVFAGNDMVAYGAYKACREAGVSIPDDISVAGFDDDYLSRYLQPPLTTMSLPAAGLGSIAAGLVAQLVSDAAGEPHVPLSLGRQTILPTRIAVRGSCAGVE